MLRAALFDLDGTLCDSDHLHFAAWRDELAASCDGFELSYEEYKSRISGKPNATIALEFLPHLDSSRREDACGSKETRFRELASGQNALKPLRGLLNLLSFLPSNQVRIACVTNAPRVNADFMLHQMGIRDWFELLVIGEECLASKPSPEPYLKAMNYFNVDARSCAIFEDSSSGLTAARSSGCALAIGICTTHGADALKQMGAHFAVRDFSELDLAALLLLSAAP
jgi:HAD superfamily hydrolase (TIGR01509 family)